MGVQAARSSAIERRFAAVIAAYVFFLHALIAGLTPLPSPAAIDLAASLYNICQPDGPGHPAPIPRDDPCLLAAFFDGIGPGHGALSPVGGSPDFAPAAITVAIALYADDRAARGARAPLAARPRGPPLPA